MRRLKTFIFLLMVFLCFDAAYAAQSNFDLKLGAAGPKDAEQTGFDAAISANLGINDFFALGLEPGFTWISWTKATGATKDIAGGGTASVEADYNAFIVPVLLNARARFPLYLSDLKSTFFVAVGAGYSWVTLNYTVPAYEISGAKSEEIKQKNKFNGFTYQAMLGIAFALSSDFNLIVEAGYRGGKPKDDDGAKFDISGWVAHVGARFNIGGSDF